MGFSGLGLKGFRAKSCKVEDSENRGQHSSSRLFKSQPWLHGMGPSFIQSVGPTLPSLFQKAQAPRKQIFRAQRGSPIL